MSSSSNFKGYAKLLSPSKQLRSDTYFQEKADAIRERSHSKKHEDQLKINNESKLVSLKGNSS